MMYLLLGIVLLLASITVVAFSVLYRPKPTGDALCAECGGPATHELLGKVTDHGIGFSATSETYCRRHAPDNAHRV